MELDPAAPANLTSQEVLVPGPGHVIYWVDSLLALVMVVSAVLTVLGNVLVIQVIRYELRKSACDFIFAQISLVHVFGGFLTFLSAIILLSGRRMLDLDQVDDVVCWVGGLLWHIVVLITLMLLCLVILGRVIMHFAPIRYEDLVNMTYVTIGSSLCWLLSCGVLAPFFLTGLNVKVLGSWGFPHIQVPSDGIIRYLMVGCFAAPFILLVMLLAVLVSSILINFEMFKKKKRKEAPKSFIQAGLRTMLAQTMVPLPTVFEGAEPELEPVRVRTTELQEASVFTTNTASRSQISQDQDCEQAKEIFRWMDEGARVTVTTSPHNIFQSRSESCLQTNWSVVSTPVSLGGRRSTLKLQSGMHGSLHSSTPSLGLIRSEMRSIFDSVVSRISSSSTLANPSRLSTTGAAPGPIARNKEQQTKIICLHLSYSYFISHFMVFLYSILLVGADPQLEVFSKPDNMLKVYLKGAYYGAVFLNSGLTPLVFWSFHLKYRQMVSFYVYKIKIRAVLCGNRLGIMNQNRN